MQVAIKVDIDTRRGLASGCPNLLKIFQEAGNIPASFFIPMGPDRTGLTITRVLKNPRILEKAKRTNIFEIYGFPTLLYGTLLPSPGIVDGNEEILARIQDEGHEAGIHGYDHFKWQDFIDRMDEHSITAELEKAFSGFKKIFRTEPKSFAAPGWQCNKKACGLIDKRHFLYTSNTRGKKVCFPVFDGWGSNTLEIPTTLPTLDELLIPKTDEAIGTTVDMYLGSLIGHGLNVLTIHTEIEGIICREFLKRLLEALKRKNVNFLRLEDIAREALSKKDSIERIKVVNKKIKGRTSLVACQS